MGLRDILEAATPGKWMVFQFQRGKGKTLWHAIDSVHGGRRVAELCSYYTCDRQAGNDATLIALAPELAALCLDMGKWIDTMLAQGGPVTSDYSAGDALLARLNDLAGEPTVPEGKPTDGNGREPS